MKKALFSYKKQTQSKALSFQFYEQSVEFRIPVYPRYMDCHYLEPMNRFFYFHLQSILPAPSNVAFPKIFATPFTLITHVPRGS